MGMLLDRVADFLAKIEDSRESHRDWQRFKLDLIRDGMQMARQILIPLIVPPHPPEVTHEKAVSSRTLTREEILTLIEEMKCLSFQTELPQRSVLAKESSDKSTIAYESATPTLVTPGGLTQIHLGVNCVEEGSGWPGLPQTRQASFGMMTAFKPKKITIAPGFALTGGFIGSRNIMGHAPGDWDGIPSEHLFSDAPQPDYPMAEKGWTITLQIKNTSKRQLAGWARVVGDEKGR